MKYGIFLGCNIPYHLPNYCVSTLSMLDSLGVKWEDVKEFGCCGYPFMWVDEESFLLLSARNLAIAEERGLDMLVLCDCCFGALKRAEYLLGDGKVRDKINKKLLSEGLKYNGRVRVKHIIQVLFYEVGLEKIGKMRKGGSLKVAVHYGCHLLRPSSITQFDDPFSPTIFDKLVEAAGAEPISWPLKTDCCGASLRGISKDMSFKVLERKLKSAEVAGADFICVTCPYCYMQFKSLENRKPSPILYPQLLGFPV